MSLEHRAIEAYRESQAGETAWKETQAKQFCAQAKQWLVKTFGDEPELVASFAPDTPTQAFGWLGGVKLRVTMPYRRRRLDLREPCPECGDDVWHGSCTSLVDLGQALVGDRTALAMACGCQRKRPLEPTTEERLASAFVDMVSDVMDDR